MKRLTLVCSIVLLLSGCLAKKKDAEVVDAGAAPDPAAAVAAVDDAAVAAADDAAVAPLAPLAAAAAPKPVAAAKPKPAVPAGNPDAPNCDNARLFCNHKDVATNPKIKEKCTAFSADCLKAGGKI